MDFQKTIVSRWMLFILCFLTLPFTMGSDLTGGSCAIKNNNNTATSTYTVGGTLSGLSGTVVLQNNGGDNLSLTSNGSFTFSTALTDGAAYSVTVLTQPSGQTCSVTNGSGTLSGSNVTNVTVTCSNITYTVGGTLSGLSGTVVLQNNGGDNLSLTSNGSFTFSTALADGAAYSVTVLTQPAAQFCIVTNGSGTISSANVTNVTVSCNNNKIIFVSASTYGGGFIGNISGADAKCMADANYPGTGTYKALIIAATRTACTTANCSGGSGEHLDWVLAANTTYTRTDSTTIGTTTSAGIFSFPVTNGFSASSNTYWSGLNSNWTSGSNTCDNWTSIAAPGSPILGLADAIDSTLINNTTQICTGFARLACVEQ